MKQPETRLQRRLQSALQARFPGCFFFKTHGSPFQMKGLPDLIGCIDGRFVAVEVKIEGNKPKPVQLHVLSQIAGSGGVAVWATSEEEAIRLVEQGLGLTSEKQSDEH